MDWNNFYFNILIIKVYKLGNKQIMIRLENLLKESFINIWTREDKEPYADQVWKILQQSYEEIGGYKGSPDVDDLIDDSSLWKLNRKGGKIVAVRIYKDKHGRKSIAAGTDGSEAGKKAVYQTMKDDLRLNRAWAEVSGKVEHILVDKLKGQPVPNIHAEKILKKKILKLDKNGYHYWRLLDGEPHRKVIVVGNNVGDFVDRVNKKIEDGVIKESDIY